MEAIFRLEKSFEILYSLKTQLLLSVFKGIIYPFGAGGIYKV